MELSRENKKATKVECRGHSKYIRQREVLIWTIACKTMILRGFTDVSTAAEQQVSQSTDCKCLTLEPVWILFLVIMITVYKIFFFSLRKEDEKIYW
jgi:hypothetical protein